MVIEVLGTGCAKCNRLEARVREVLRRSGREAEVNKVTSLAEIAALGAMLTPALVIDGEILSEGQLPSEAELERWIGGGDASVGACGDG